ncbi:MAG: insulinase family protein [Candidatus Cloacimonetes bacterium]|nr:insulinase family protein [Candidatus Cloacimonadota bacterium]
MKKLLFLFLVVSQLPLFCGSLIQKPVRKFKLRSGSTLIFQENKRADLINVSMAVKLPSMEGDVDGGTNYMLGEYLRKHDKSLIHFLYGDGVPVHEHSFAVYNDYIKIWFSMLKKDQDVALNAICKNYFRPTWDKEVFEKIKKKAVKKVELITKEKLSWGRLHTMTLNETHSGSILAKTAYPLPEDLSAVTMESLQKLHARIFTPLGLSFSVVGNISLKDLLKKVDSTLASLNNQKPVTQVKKRNETLIEKVHYDDVKESMAMISFFGPKPASKDYLKFTKLKNLLEIGFDGLLSKVAKETKGIYDLDINYSLVQSGSMIHISYKDENNKPEVFAKKVFEVLMSYRETKINEKELVLFKRTLHNNYIEMQSNPNVFVQKAITLGIYDSMFSSSIQYTREIDALSSEDLRDVFTKYISLDSYQYHSIEPIANKTKSVVSHKKFNLEGVSTLLEEDPNQQMVGVSWSYQFDDDRSNPLLAAISMMTLKQASSKVKNQKIQARVKTLGLKIGSSIQINRVANSFQMPVNDLDGIVRVLPHLVFDYQITKGDFENALREFKQTSEMLKSYKADYSPFYKELFPRKYLMFPHLVDQSHLKTINFKKVKAYLASSIAKSRVKLVLAGDFSIKSMQNKLRKSFKKFFKRSPQYDVNLDKLSAYVTKEIKRLKVNREDSNSRYRVFRGSIYEKGDLTVREEAAVFISVLNFLIHAKDFKEDGFEDINMNLSFQGLGGVMALVIHFDGPKEQSAELKDMLDRKIARITDKVSESVLEKLKTFFMYNKNQEKLNIKKRANSLGSLFGFDYPLDYEDKLVKEAAKLNAADIEKIFKEKFDGNFIMQINGSK